MLICRNAEGVHGKKKVGNPCCSARKSSRPPRNFLTPPGERLAPHLRTTVLNALNWAKPETRHNQLPSIIWNFYYGATKLLQAGNYVVIISN